jgi:hypothetical protein
MVTPCADKNMTDHGLGLKAQYTLAHGNALCRQKHDIPRSRAESPVYTCSGHRPERPPCKGSINFINGCDTFIVLFFFIVYIKFCESKRVGQPNSTTIIQWHGIKTKRLFLCLALFPCLQDKFNGTKSGNTKSHGSDRIKCLYLLMQR